MTNATPSLALLSSLTGRAVESGEALDGAHWRRQARQNGAVDRCVDALASQGAGLVIQIGPLAGPGAATGMASAGPSRDAKPTMVLLTLQRSPSNASPSDEGRFVQAVAGAYDAGLPIRFEGLLAGETRRRVSLSTYPFQRRRHWVSGGNWQGGNQPEGHPVAESEAWQ